jgi:hypothetical protein
VKGGDRKLTLNVCHLLIPHTPMPIFLRFWKVTGPANDSVLLLPNVSDERFSFNAPEDGIYKLCASSRHPFGSKSFSFVTEKVSSSSYGMNIYQFSVLIQILTNRWEISWRKSGKVARDSKFNIIWAKLHQEEGAGEQAKFAFLLQSDSFTISLFFFF